MGFRPSATLDPVGFVIQSKGMDDVLASENLRVIRTLMERSALYRRALAPVSLATGGLGLAAGVLGWFLKLDTSQGFVGFWLATAVVASGTSLWIVRRQALIDGDAFFPAIDPLLWRCISQEEHRTDDRHTYAFSYEMYERA